MVQRANLKGKFTSYTTFTSLLQMKDKMVCPQCKKTTVSGKGNKYRPFCSERCKLIDLGEWAKEEKSISRNIYPKEIH